MIGIKGLKLIVLTVLSWAARLAFRSDLTVGLIIRQLIISVLIGYLAAEYILSQTYDEWIKMTVFCSLVFLADDILVMVIAFGKYAKDNQDKIFTRITKIFTGK